MLWLRLDSLIVTELCNGTLHDLVVVNKDYYSKLTPYQLKNVVLREIVEGVKYLHDNGIIHRDLKPHNILYCIIISKAGRIRQLVMKVADFGCSRSVPEGGDHYTRTMTKKGDYSNTFRPFGTDGWLAPEVLNGVKELRPPHAVDIYPLGLIFAFTLLRGRHPYGEDATTRNERVKKKQPMPDIIRHQLIDEHGDGCYVLINRMLDPNPEERPTAAEILDVVRDSKVCFIINLLILLYANLYNEARR